jgi:hypothetical protein
MANITMTSGNRYTFAAIDGSPVLIGSTDFAGETTFFRNNIHMKDVNGDGTGMLTIDSTSSQVSNGPQIRLSQTGAGNTGIHFDQGNGGTYTADWTVGIDSSEGTHFRWNASTALTSTPEMMLATSGVLSLNASSATFAMYVSNDGNSDDRDGINIQCGKDTNPGTGTDWLRFADGNGTGLGWIYGNGGTTPNFSGQAGSVASDIRNKRDFVPMASSSRGAQSIINGIDIFEYRYKSWDWMTNTEKAKVDSEVRIGVSAQAMESSSLSYVVDSKEFLNTKIESDKGGTISPEDYGFNFKEVDYREIVPILIQTTKEQYATIQNLEARIVALENA